MNWPPPERPLEGSIVRLEPASEAHRDPLREAAASDSDIWTWVNRDVAEDGAAFDAWFDQRRLASEHGDEWCFVTHSPDGEVLGSSSFLHVRPEHDGLEIGWTWLRPSEWRTGANIEAKLLMLGFAFDDLGCMRVEFKTDARNQRSRSALEALPAQFEGVFRKHMLPRGIGVRDSAYYSIIDDEWADVRANLERRLAKGAVESNA